MEALLFPFFFASPIDRGGRKDLFLLLYFLPHQKQDLGVFVVEAERVEDRVDPARARERGQKETKRGKRKKKVVVSGKRIDGGIEPKKTMLLTPLVVVLLLHASALLAAARNGTGRRTS